MTSTSQVYQLPVNKPENSQIDNTDHRITLLLNIAINGIATLPNNKSIDVNSDVQYDVPKSVSDKSSSTPSDDGQTKQSPFMAMATEVMQVLKSYSINCNAPGVESRDVEAFLPTIAKFIEKQEPVRMVLPAFPFKSPNSQDKVMGILPDLGEELALQHLNALCQNVAKVYEPGAEVHITSDGLVYNDILGVTDETVWNYGEALRQIAIEQGLRHLHFLRLDELLGHEELSSRSAKSAKEFYLSHASCMRRELMLRFGDRSFCPRTAIKNDSDIRATYRGYIKFLTKDIAPQINSMSKRAKGEHIAQVAQSMIVRGQMFAAAIKAQRGDFLRLSIHESTKSQKVSVSLNPQDQNAIGHTPWHSCVVVGVDGSYRAAHVDQVRNTHDLVIKNGQPYCYRERSELFDWSKEGLNVDFEHLYPCGLIIRPINNSGESPSIRTIAMSKLRQLSCNMSPVICRGFENTEGEGLFIEKAAELGKIATWSQDVIIKVKDSKRVDKENNNVKSNEAMPMHYDGMFKFYDETDPITGETTRVQNVPKYQLFLCRATASEDDDGKTLFASSRLFFRYLPSPWTRERLEKVTWSMENDGFWDAKVYKLPLLLTHPTSGQPCLRWHQPWDSTKTKFSTCKVTIDNDDASIISTIDNLIYDYRVCYRFKWKVGDLLVSDNMSMLHTRTGYSSNCDRELWRIHCD